MNADRPNPFLHFAALGYGARLIPIIPPDADISPRSNLHKRVGKPGDGRGKTPGIRHTEGLWSSFSGWPTYVSEAEDWARWGRMGAGVGIRTGEGLLGIDADTMDRASATIIRDVIAEHTGAPSIRVGRFPKALYPIRCSEPYRYTRIDFGQVANKKFADRVEILSDRKQFVAHGVHPVTRAPYDWPRALVPFDELPIVTAAVLDAMMAELRAALPRAADKIVREGSERPADPTALRGDPYMVRQAVEATPNTAEFFPTRNDYVTYAYALRGALPDNPDEGRALYLDWCEKWHDGPPGEETNDLGVAEADWNRACNPPRVGAGWLYEMAEKASGGAFNRAAAWFEPVEIREASPFDVAARAEAKREAADTYPLLTVADLMTRDPPNWLVARHLPEVGVGFIYSAPGAGKTFLTLDMALHVACGAEEWHGDAISGPENPAVLYIASEGSFDLKNRIDAWLRHREMGADRAKSFFVIERTIDFMAAEDVAKLIRTVREASAVNGCRFAMVVVDTVSRAMPGADENLQKEMTLFVAACDRVRDAFGCAVVGVHHAGKDGDMRGSTVLRGAGDFVFRLTRRVGASVGVLTCEKMKAGPDGWETPWRFDSVDLGEGQSSLVVVREAVGIGPVVELTPDVAGRVLKAMAAAWEAGEPWSKAPQAGERRAVRRMVDDFGFGAAEAERLIDLWERSGTIVTEMLSSKTKIRGLRVAQAGQPVQQEGIFG